MDFEFDVVQVDVADEYTLKVVFKDNTKGIIYFKPSFFKGVFKLLLDKKEFEKVFIDNDTVTWKNGLDIAPGTLYEKIKSGNGVCIFS